MSPDTPPDTALPAAPENSAAAPAPGSAPSTAPYDWRAALRRPPVLIAVLALALLGWQWLETRVTFREVRDELTRRLAEGDAVAKDARLLARQTQENVVSLQAKVGALEAKLAETQGQQLALEAMYQELSKSRDERLLSEIDQAVSIAAQQLQLAGNVEAALIALQGADARLARAGNARLLGLRKLLARDIEHLKSLPSADVPGIALKLETVIAGVDSMPLAFEQRPKTTTTAKPAQSPAELGFWQAMALDVWNDTKQLVRIERIDRPDPGLLSPSQNFFLRENLKLRLVNARLALLARDGRSFREDMRQTRDWLERYFDTRAKPVQAALTSVKALGATDLFAEPPSLNDTLNALRNVKVIQQDREPPLPAPRSHGGARAPAPRRRHTGAA